MRLLTAAAQRELDRLAAAEAELPTRVLMESAGAAVARAVAELKPRKVVVFCGPGNNGGDGSVAARLLHQGIPEVYTWYTRAPETLKGDAALAAKAFIASGGQQAKKTMRGGSGVVLVDAVFGSGLSRAPEGPEAEAIRMLNTVRERGAQVVAVDVPSGIDADTGHVYPVHLAKADLTVTFPAPKRVPYLHPGADSAGRILGHPSGSRARSKRSCPARPATCSTRNGPDRSFRPGRAIRTRTTTDTSWSSPDRRERAAPPRWCARPRCAPEQGW